MMPKRIFYKLLPLSIIIAFSLTNCGRSERFPKIGLNVAGAIDVAAHHTGDYFYVLNSDYARTYNKGSILVLDEQGEAVSAIETPRLGRHLNISGDLLLAGFAASERDTKPTLWLIDVSQPEQPRKVKKFELDCTPLNAAIEQGYPYFALSCGGGHLYIGQLHENLEESTLHLARRYGRERRALYLDTKRDLVYAFTTIMGEQNFTDLQADDVAHFDPETNQMEEGANEVPDVFENTLLQRRQTGRRQLYQFVVFDIAAAASEQEPFMFREIGDERLAARDVVANELRWMYFTLTDIDGHPDTSAGFTNPNIKHYRTNFWTAKPDPNDKDAFYLSHRSPSRSGYSISNNIIRVEIHGDPRPSDGQRPFTSDFFSFERVYGFASEIDLEEKKHFTGDFVLEQVAGQQVLLVNHFRDLVSFSRREARFSLAAKVLDGAYWLDEIVSSAPSDSFYQIAMNQRGVAFTCSFYGDAVIRLEVQPGAAITNLSRID